ncbi:MAG: polysaccharide deacetylase family protein, partial [Bacteroidia bacterium]
IMLHHFHGGKHPSIQGSLSALDFEVMIEALLSKGLIPASGWKYKYKAGILKPNEFCLTFDDNLKSQIDIAVPVLSRYGLDAFWFVYTSPFQGVLEKLELYRFFRNVCYLHIDNFYTEFFRVLELSPFATEVYEKSRTVDFNSYLPELTFYSVNDKKFRYLRDKILGQDRYYSVMDEMMRISDFDKDKWKDRIWLNKMDIRYLVSIGHEIGLHSHTHPTQISSLSRKAQMDEYRINRDILTELTSQKLSIMAHPNGDYNEDTFTVLSQLDIEMGFCATPNDRYGTQFELPRIDQTLLHLTKSNQL